MDAPELLNTYPPISMVLKFFSSAVLSVVAFTTLNGFGSQNFPSKTSLLIGSILIPPCIFSEAKGDLEVDCHHTIEDTGIVLGEAIRQAVGDKKGICRFGECILPMDETLVLCALDLSGRPYLRYHLDLTVPSVGQFDTEMVHEFFYAVSYAAGMNLHVKQLDGENNHHIIEAAFKSFAKALDRAVSYDGRISDVLSTKGSL